MRRGLIIAVIASAMSPTVGASLGLAPRSDQDFVRAIYLLWAIEATAGVAYLWWLFRRGRKLQVAATWGIITLALLLSLPLYGLRFIADKRALFASEQEQLANVATELAPDNKPSPLLICPIGIGITIGGNFFGGVEFPFTALAIHDKPVLVLDMTPKGLVASFDVRDNEGTILARVNRNVVEVYAPGHIKPRRSPHRLSMTDEQGTPVLDMEYLNQSAISIHGKFYIAPHIYLLMDETATQEIDSRTNQELTEISRYIGCDVDVGLNL